jgi:F0F1-type ATP synthase membrane subunit b/b'
MRWLLRVLRLTPRPNGTAAADAQRHAERKLEDARRQHREVRREADRFARMIDDALRGRPV